MFQSQSRVEFYLTRSAGVHRLNPINPFWLLIQLQTRLPNRRLSCVASSTSNQPGFSWSTRGSALGLPWYQKILSCGIIYRLLLHRVCTCCCGVQSGELCIDGGPPVWRSITPTTLRYFPGPLVFDVQVNWVWFDVALCKVRKSVSVECPCNNI